jgi:hypothetical protein
MPRTNSHAPNVSAVSHSSSHLANRKLTKQSVLRISIVAGLFVLLALSLTARPWLSSAQEERRKTVSEAASLPEARSIVLTEKPVVVAQEDTPSLSPEGAVCSWTNGTVFPITILDQATVVLGNTLYTFGGVSTAIIANAYKFDGTTWTPIAPLPAALEFPTAVTDGTFIYVLGGALTGTGTPQTTVYRYDTVLNTYTPMAPFTTGTWNQAVAYLNGKIYKFTGTGPATASTNVLEIYDVATNMWSAGAPYPLLISFVSAFVQGNFVYGAGGIQSVGSLASLKTYRYDPVMNVWDDASIADLPLTRWGAASSAVGYGTNNGWVLAGGYVNGVATANISTTVIRWDPVGNSWAILSSMTGERARMTGGILGSSFYVLGGRSIASAGFVGTNSNQKLTCISNQAVISSGPVNITAESCGTPNNSPEPGETLTVTLPLMNAGDIPTTNLIATLQATGGVTSPSSPQNYGVVPPTSMPVVRSFTFTVDPNLACGAPVTLTWTIADGATNYPNASQMYTTGIRTTILSENFDGVTAPALPVGWVNTQTSGTAVNWTTTTTTPFSAPNAAFANDPATVNAAALSTPAVMITSADAQLSFKNKYITESTFDGCVLEFSTNGGGTWTDIITGGGSFVSGGYNGLISTAFMNPIMGRNAWTGTSAGGYIDTLVNLPAALNGQSVMFRWLIGTDNSVAATGQWVDDVKIVGARVCQVCFIPVPEKPIADFDGDGKSDVSVFRPSNNIWYILRSSNQTIQVQQFGQSGDKIVPGDYDGDAKADVAVFRNGDWFVRQSSNGTVLIRHFGGMGDIPAAADYDGDGRTDFSVYRPSLGLWYVEKSANFMVTTDSFGVNGDLPVPADYNGDGKADIALFRPSTSTWYLSTSPATNYGAVQFGTTGDKPVQGDYDDDGKADVAVFRPSNGTWYIRGSAGALHTVPWGTMGDIATSADYDGDGDRDIAVFRPATGTWYIRGVVVSPPVDSPLDSSVQFGTNGDKPVPSAYVPEQ